jgi:hypothetical protein
VSLPVVVQLFAVCGRHFCGQNRNILSPSKNEKTCVIAGKNSGVAISSVRHGDAQQLPRMILAAGIIHHISTETQKCSINSTESLSRHRYHARPGLPQVVEVGPTMKELVLFVVVFLSSK